MSVQGIVIKVHLTRYCDVDTENIMALISTAFPINVNVSLELVVDRLVLHDPDPRHLLEHLLPRERLQAIDLQLWIPEILEGFRRLVHLLKMMLSTLIMIATSRERCFFFPVKI